MIRIHFMVSHYLEPSFYERAILDFYWYLRSNQKSNNNVSNANIIIIIVRPLRNPTLTCEL